MKYEPPWKHPDPWQKEILEYEDHLCIGKGRRIGATYIMGIKAIEYLMKHENHHPTSQIICVSLTEDQAQLIILFAKQYAQEKYGKFIGKGKDKPTLNRIIMVVNGNRRILLARPVGVTGDSVRGFEGQVLMVDEASRMPKLFWAAAKPVLLTTGGKIWMWSTFHGMQEYFWKSFNEAHNLKDPKARFKTWLFNSEEVIENRKISPSWTQEQREEALKILEEERRDMTQAEYDQEYLGKPSDKLRKLFDEDLIREMQTLERPAIVGINKDYYLGADIARLGEDESTFESFDGTDEEDILHVEHIKTTKTLTTSSTRIILDLENKFDYIRIFMDAYGVGTGVFDDLLTDERTKEKVVAIGHASRPLDDEEKQKTKVTEWDLYENCKRLLEQKKLKLLKGDDIFHSLNSIQYEYVEKKIIIISADKHIADGIVRGTWCSRDKSLNCFIM